MIAHALAGAPIAAAVVAVWLLRLRWWPYGPCRACKHHRGRNPGSTSTAWGRCRRCGGSGETLRRGARIWPRWRNLPRRPK